MLLLNFGHPLTPDHLARLEELTGRAITDVYSFKAQFDHDQPFGPQAVQLADAANLTAEQWQTLPLLINPPAHNLIALTLLAELHGRLGYFPAVVRLKPIPNALPPQFEVAEIINLQTLRDQARVRR